MSRDCVKLTTYFGERARAGDSFLADALTDIYARHGLHTSVLMRGFEGFGSTQRLRTARLLTLSEDLPLVSVAVDAPARIERALADVRELGMQGLVTLERALLLEAADGPRQTAEGAAESSKLTIYLGRHERAGGARASRALVALLREQGLAGATVLLGVDGTLDGERRRARFFARNTGVPLMVIAVGAQASIDRVAPMIGERFGQPAMTLERVRVCKRDGRALDAPGEVPERDDAGLGIWQKLMVFSGAQALVDGLPLHERLVGALRAERAAGVTCLRGIWGYHGDHAPHGDSYRQLRRRVPVVTVIVDTPERSRRWYEIADGLTRETGLVTSELVPAYRATAPGLTDGGLRMAEPAARGRGTS